MSLQSIPIRSLSIALVLAFSLAGCLGGDDPTPGNGIGGNDEPGDTSGESSDTTNGDTTDENGTDAAPEETCTDTIQHLTSWSHDGPALPDPAGLDPEDPNPEALLGESSSADFQVPEGTTSLIITATAGDYISAGWEISLVDPAGSEQYTFSGAAGPNLEGVTGEAMEDTGSVGSPTPGGWTLVASISGYVEGLNIEVEANVCQ
jgi:hypothetical protein